MDKRRKSLIALIRRHLKVSGRSATAFGYLSVGDPGFLRDLEAGRVPREKTILKIKGFIGREL